MKKVKVIIILILLMITAGVLLKAYKNEDTKITINIDNSLINNNMLGLNTERSITSSLIHRIRYSTKVKVTDRLISVNEKGRCHTLLNIDNGKIYNVWFDNNCLFLLYQPAFDFYYNTNTNLRLYIYDYIKGKKISESIMQERIWGIDYADNEPIYDNEDIKIEYGLASNIFCDNKKRLYMDGRFLKEYDKEDRIIRRVLGLPEDAYATIAKLDALNDYVIIQDYDRKKVKIYLLNQQYELIAEKELDFSLKLAGFGDSFMILIDANDNIIKLGEEMKAESVTLFKTGEKGRILNIAYDSEQELFNILTGSELIVVDKDFKNSTKYILSERLFNFISKK